MLSKKQRLPIAEFFGPKAPRYSNFIKGKYFSLKIYPAAQKYARFGVVLSKKIANKASARNRIKRIVFRVFQSHLSVLPVFDYLCLPTSAAASAEKNRIEADLNEVLRPLILNTRY